MTNNYDDNERYEKIEDGVYYDTVTEETVFTLTEEEQVLLTEIIRQQEESQG